MDLTENKRYNRVETANDHHYGGYEWGGIQERAEHPGVLKCKLGHGKGRSVIIPDLILLGEDGQGGYIQPIQFVANKIFHLDDESVCSLFVDISCGVTVEVRFSSGGFLRSLEDASQLFRCTIYGPRTLQDHVTGESSFINGEFFVKLFHHTKPEYAEAIKTSGNFRISNYNIQGTSKRLKDRGYAYFTPLHQVTHDSDLKMLAMERSGVLLLVTDGFSRPPVVFEGPTGRWWDGFPEYVLALEVYESKADDRKTAVGVWVQASAIASQHILDHDSGFSRFYEIACPFIHRVGAPNGSVIPFDTEFRIWHTSNLLNLDYVVIGDATTLSGLAAPYDEEDTSEIFKLLRTDQDFLTYWKAHANEELFTGTPVSFQEFEGS